LRRVSDDHERLSADFEERVKGEMEAASETIEEMERVIKSLNTRVECLSGNVERLEDERRALLEEKERIENFRVLSRSHTPMGSGPVVPVPIYADMDEVDGYYDLYLKIQSEFEECKKALGERVKRLESEHVAYVKELEEKNITIASLETRCDLMRGMCLIYLHI
jgi:DNA repair exonuclease SbcCD ATPase subunit